jgi:Zn-dependent peptidase ImmA (M78 family)
MEEAEVQMLGRAFVAGVDITNIQSDLTPYVVAANAKVRVEELGEGESGTTFTTPKGTHVITVNSLESEERQRFTICHEVAHIVLGLESSHTEVPPWSFAKRDPNEMACDTFAAELLMPLGQWGERVPRAEPSLEVIGFMADEFKTSFVAAASRYASLSAIPCAYVTSERGRIRYAARSTSLRRAGAWIAPRSPVPVGSVAHRLREAGLSDIATGEVAQDVWFENWKTGLDLWELARHYKSSDTTVALLWFSEEELAEVERTRFGVKFEDEGGLSELTGELSWPSGKKRR